MNQERSSVADFLNKNNEKHLEDFPVKMNMLNCKQLKEEIESLQETVDMIRLSAYGDGDFIILAHRKNDLKLVKNIMLSKCK